MSTVRRERKQFIAFYVSDEEKETIIKNAKECDMTISDYCRKVLVKDTVAKQKQEE